MDIEKIRPYYDAFINTKQNGTKINYKIIATKCKINPKYVTTVFGKLGNKKLKTVASDAHIRSVYIQIKKFWKIDEDGFLVLLNPKVTEKDSVPITQKHTLIAHKNFSEARVGDAATAANNSEIWILNTYLADKLYQSETPEDDPECIRNWLKEGKKLRLLFLRPDGKGMALRVQSDLGQSNGAGIATKLIERLETILQWQREFKDQLQVRLMDEIPGMSCIIMNECLFYGIHFSFGHTEGASFFEEKDKKSNVYTDIKRHFDTFWADDRSTPLTEELLNTIKAALTITRTDLKYLPGNWEIKLHDLSEMYRGEGPAPSNLVSGELGTFNLTIEKPERDIYMKAILTIPDGPTLEAKLITEHLSDRDYAHIRFSDFHKLSVHLTIHCKRDNNTDPLMGFFIMNSGSDSSTGVVILHKKETSAGIKVYKENENKIKRMLAFSDGSFIGLNRVRTEFENFRFPYTGLYKVYSYGGIQNSNKCIKINWLYINEYGEAHYKNQHFKNENNPPLVGRATIIGNNLHLVFTTFNPTKRRSYLIISVNEVLPKINMESGRYYSGVHLGVTFDKGMPVGKRFIFEQTYDNFEKVEPQTIALHSEDYYKIDTSIRALLSGRMKNLLGFLRTKGNISNIRDIEYEWQQSVQLNEVFYESAYYLLTAKQDIRTGIDMLFRAVNHGFSDIERFEKEIDDKILEKMRKDIEYQKIIILLSHNFPAT